MPPRKDRWAEWLAERRDGGDFVARRKSLDELAHWRDAVLDNARLAEGDTLLDVGCGEGLIGFGALERGASTVVFSDISADLLDFCREAATELGVLDRSRFVEAPADDLSAIDSDSADVVTTRSVLIYVTDKESAFREFARVLRPGGRISLFEPINRFARRGPDTLAGYDLGAVPEIAAKIRAVYEAAHPRDTGPMVDFDERDLLAFAERAGFFPIHLHLDAEIASCEPRSWKTFLGTAPNPLVSTLADAMDRALDAEERAQLTAHLRPLVEEGRGSWRMATALVHAVKP